MSATRELLDRCEAARTHATRCAEANPALALRDRRWAATNGWVSTFDDPNLTVRASVLEQVCREALGIPAPPPADGDQFALDLVTGGPS